MESPDLGSLDERTLASARSKSDQMMEAVTVTFVDDEFLALIVMGLRPGEREPEQQADEIWRPPLTIQSEMALLIPSPEPETEIRTHNNPAKRRASGTGNARRAKARRTRLLAGRRGLGKLVVQRFGGWRSCLAAFHDVLRGDRFAI